MIGPIKKLAENNKALIKEKKDSGLGSCDRCETYKTSSILAARIVGLYSSGCLNCDLVLSSGHCSL